MEKSGDIIDIEENIKKLIAKGFDLKLQGRKNSAAKAFWSAYKLTIRRSNLLSLDKQQVEEKAYGMWTSVIDFSDSD